MRTPKLKFFFGLLLRMGRKRRLMTSGWYTAARVRYLGRLSHFLLNLLRLLWILVIHCSDMVSIIRRKGMDGAK